MHRIAIHRVELHFLPVQKGRLRGDRAGRHHVTVGKDQAALGVDDETGRLRRRIPLSIECPGRIDVDGHDAARDPLEGRGPVGILFHGRSLLCDCRRLLCSARRRGCRRLHGQRLRRALLSGPLLRRRLPGGLRQCVRCGRWISSEANSGAGCDQAQPEQSSRAHRTPAVESSQKLSEV